MKDKFGSDIFLSKHLSFILLLLTGHPREGYRHISAEVFASELEQIVFHLPRSTVPLLYKPQKICR